MNRLVTGAFKVRLDFGELLWQNSVFGGLSESFNKMADELDHTEVLRSDFVNNFSHEFKTPIVSITGFEKLMRKGELTEEQRMAEQFLSSLSMQERKYFGEPTRIFNKFYQADTSHYAEGTGIGLAVARRVTELHEGVIYLESEKGVTMFKEAFCCFTEL